MDKWLGQTLKQICFWWSGWVTKKGATGDIFFHICQKILFLFQKWTIFSYQPPPPPPKKKKLGGGILLCVSCLSCSV